MANPFGRPAFTSALFYKDPMAALAWLEKAFGFERVMVITDKDGNLAHSEMRFGGGLIMVGTEWTDYVASPASTGGRNTQSIHVHLDDGIDAHCERAKAAGAVIVRELAEPVLWRPHLFGARSRRPRLELWPERAEGLARGGREGQRAEDRGLALTQALAIDRTLAALAEPARRRVVDLLRERPHRAGELATCRRASARRR